MAGTVRYLNRQLLQNVLHHVDTHNRLMEEKEMWKTKKTRRVSSSDSDDSEWRRSDTGRGRNYGKMRSDEVRQSSDSNRNIFKKKLDEGKWNHSGFMEMYPDEFLNKDSMDEMSSDEDKKQKKRKRKKQKRIREKSSERNGRTANYSHGKSANHSNGKLANHSNAKLANHEYSMPTNHRTPQTGEASNAWTSNVLRDKRKRKHRDEKESSGKKTKYSEEMSGGSSTTSDEWNELEATVFDLKKSPEKRRKVKSDSSPRRLKDKRRRKQERKEKHRKHEKRRNRSKHDVKR